jgi:hypothetical protein
MCSISSSIEPSIKLISTTCITCINNIRNNHCAPAQWVTYLSMFVTVSYVLILVVQSDQKVAQCIGDVMMTVNLFNFTSILLNVAAHKIHLYQFPSYKTYHWYSMIAVSWDYTIGKYLPLFFWWSMWDYCLKVIFNNEHPSYFHF